LQASSNPCKHWGSPICHFPTSGNKRTLSQRFCYQICYQPTEAEGNGFDTAALVDGGSLLTVKEVATVLRVSTATVYAMCERGELVHARVSNSIRVSVEALAFFLKRQDQQQ
jgi:excisionase family DNA binding protein